MLDWSVPIKDLAEIGLFFCIPVTQSRILRLFAALRILATRYGMKITRQGDGGFVSEKLLDMT